MIYLVIGICIFHVEAVSLTCDNTTDVCPGTELTCICSVYSTNSGVMWTLPGSETILLDEKVGSNGTTTDGTFFAANTNKTGGVLESILIYTVTESLVNGTIECLRLGGIAMSTIITDTLAG